MCLKSNKTKMSSTSSHKKLKFCHTKNQFLAVFCANLAALASGASAGWLSPSVLVLQSANTPLIDGPINNEMVSWLGSSAYFGGFCGNIMFTTILRHLGRKKTFCVLALPNLTFWIIVIFATRIEVLYVGRFLAGLTGGGTYVCVALFVAEIADDHIRGILGSSLSISTCVGVMISYIAGAYLSYSTTPLVIMIFPIAFTIAFLVLPESPNHLMKQKRFDDAARSLRFYKNCYKDTKEENERFMKEWDNVQVIAQQTIDRGDKISFADFCTPEARIGLLKGIAFVLLYLFSGVTVLVNYASLIFKASGSHVDPNLSSIIMIALQLVATTISTTIIDNIGRRSLLIVSSMGTAIGLSAMGTYTYLSYNMYQLDGYDWMPVASISFSVFMAYVGVVPMVIVALMEVLPVKIRSAGASYCLLFSSLFMIALIKFYPMVQASIHLHWCMWIFAAVSALGVPFGLLLEETKGKNINVE